MQPYVIVGNGVAAINAAEAIRARGDRTPIIIFTDQECAFYSRPSLYYILLGRLQLDDAWGRPDDFYRRNDIDLRCQTSITKIDPEAHAVEVEGNGAVSYSRLLLACGTRGRMLPWAEQPLRGLITLNTLMDVKNITDLLAEAKAAVIVGGGLTSIELAEVCRHWGVPATFVMRGDRFFDRQLTDDEAELIHARLRAAGAEVRTNEEVVAVEGKEGRVSLAATGTGDEIPCDVAACTIGVIANAELAREAGAETDRGLVVDDHMQTTLPDVYAAGDIAQLRRPDGTAAPSEMLWYVAGDTGAVAGANMAGGEETYQRRVFLNVAEFCGMDFCGVGSIDPAEANVETVVIRPDNAEGSIRLVMRDGVLIGACFLGDIRLSDIARGLIAKQVRPQELPADHPLRLLFERRSP